MKQNDKMQKNTRTLDMYTRLCEGKTINKTEEAKKLMLNEFRHIKEMRSERMIRVTFGGSSAFEPFIGNAVLEYKTPLNILYANTKTINGNAEGEMILQLPESQEIADRMIEYFKENNLGVEEVDHYVG